MWLSDYSGTRQESRRAEAGVCILHSVRPPLDRLRPRRLPPPRFALIHPRVLPERSYRSSLAPAGRMPERRARLITEQAYHPERISDPSPRVTCGEDAAD